MSAQALFTTREAAEYLRLKSARAAKRRLIEIGVRPFSFGPGRGRGDLWRRTEIDDALESTRTAKAGEPPRVRRNSPGIMGRDINELIRELTEMKTNRC